MSDLNSILDRARWPARLAYLAILLLATLTEAGAPSGGVGERIQAFFRVSFSPRNLVDAVRNVALFTGWGLVWMATAAPGGAAREIRNAVLTGLGVSLTVETIQLFFSTRTPSVMDVTTNTLGAFLGAFLLVRMVQLTAAGQGKRSFVGIPAALFALSYSVVAFGEAFLPLLRQNRFPNFGSAFERFQVALSQFSWSSMGTLPAEEFLLFAPVGALAVAALNELGLNYKKAAVASSVAGGGLVVLAEVIHGFLPMPIIAGAALVHAVAIAAGAVAAATFLPKLTRALRGANRPRAIYLFYGFTLLLWALRPYAPERSLGGMLEKLAAPWWLPLAFARERMDLFTVFDVIGGFFLYLPLGALLAVWPLKKVGPLRGVVPALAFLVATEFMQLAVLGRTLSVDDMLVATAGVLVGWVLVRRAGFKPYGAVLS